MDTVTLDDAKSNLSRLVERAAAGEEILIEDAGRPLARLVPAPQPVGHRTFGFLAGQVWVGDDFDDPLPDEIAKAFAGEAP